jgi:hypothetical protein
VPNIYATSGRKTKVTRPVILYTFGWLLDRFKIKIKNKQLKVKRASIFSDIWVVKAMIPGQENAPCREG